MAYKNCVISISSLLVLLTISFKTVHGFAEPRNVHQNLKTVPHLKKGVLHHQVLFLNEEKSLIHSKFSKSVSSSKTEKVDLNSRDYLGTGSNGDKTNGHNKIRKEVISVSERSAEIIRKQDAEEGKFNKIHPKSKDIESHRVNATLNHRCNKPVVPKYGSIHGSNWSTGSKVHILCDTGYKLHGSAVLTCSEDATWSPQSHYACIRISDCEPPQVPDNGYLIGNDYSFHRVVQIQCEDGFKLYGPPAVTCVKHPSGSGVGQWLPYQEYGCFAKQESKVDLESQLDWKNSETPYNIDNHEENRENFIMVYPEMLHKSDDITIDYKCAKPNPLIHGSVTGSDYSIGSLITYQCQDGYQLIGPSEATCLAIPDPFNHRVQWVPFQEPFCREESFPRSYLPMMLLNKANNEAVNNQLIRKEKQTSLHHATKQGFILRERMSIMCSKSPTSTLCRATTPGYYFDSNIGKCLQFPPFHCGTSENNFESYLECQKHC